MTFMQCGTQTVYLDVIPLTPHCTTRDNNLGKTHLKMELAAIMLYIMQKVCQIGVRFPGQSYTNNRRRLFMLDGNDNFYWLPIVTLDDCNLFLTDIKVVVKCKWCLPLKCNIFYFFKGRTQRSSIFQRVIIQGLDLAGLQY